MKKLLVCFAHDGVLTSCGRSLHVRHPGSPEESSWAADLIVPLPLLTKRLAGKIQAGCGAKFYKGILHEQRPSWEKVKYYEVVFSDEIARELVSLGLNLKKESWGSFLKSIDDAEVSTIDQREKGDLNPLRRVLGIPEA